MQGGKVSSRKELGRLFSWLDELEYTTLGLPKPDCVVLLSVPTGTAQQLFVKITVDHYLLLLFPVLRPPGLAAVFTKNLKAVTQKSD